MDVRRQVSSRHLVHLHVIDVYRRGGRRPKNAAPGASIGAPSSSSIVCVRWFLPRFGSLCRALHPHRQACSGYPYIRTVKLVRGIPVVTSILRPLAGASSSPSSASTPDQNSSDDYPEVGTSTYGEPVKGGCLILLVAPNGNRSHNRSSRYPTIRR
jgi:hypothetical protein